MAVRKKLGDLLIEDKAIDELQLRAALVHQRQWGGRVGRILVDMRFVKEQQICEAVARQLHVPYIQLVGQIVESRLLDLVPLEVCERHRVFPVKISGSERTGGKLLLAMSDPTNLAVVDELRFRTGKHIDVAVAADSHIDLAIRRHFYGEVMPEWNPRAGGGLVEVQFGWNDIELAESAQPPTPGPRSDPASALSPLTAAPDAAPTLVIPIGVPGTSPGDVHDTSNALGPAGALAAFDPVGDEVVSARRALFGAPGLMEGAPTDETGLAWVEPDMIEELEPGAEEEPLVVGTLIEPPVKRVSAEVPQAKTALNAVPGPTEHAESLESLSSAATLVADLEAMAAGHKDLVAPGRLAAGLALALIRNGHVHAADLVVELRRLGLIDEFSGRSVGAGGKRLHDR